MRGEKKNNGAEPGWGRHGRRGLPLALILASSASPVSAGVWNFNPYLDLAETYTDNVSLASDDERAEWVTEINPGFSLDGKSARTQLNLDYRLQNLFYASGGSYGSHHQLNADGNVEVAREFFFVDARSSINQQIIDPNVSSPMDNINTGNRATVVTYGVSPYFKLRAGPYVEGEVRYSADQVVNESAATADALTTRYNARFNSGRAFTRLNWGVDYAQEDMDRGQSFDTHRESASGVLRYRLVRTFNALARGGYESNDTPIARGTRNGSYWSVGGEWIPNRYLTVSASKGENYRDANIDFQPTVRTRLHVGYRNRTVGLNPGDVWSADLSHQTRQSTWRLSYLEDTTDIQTLQLADQQFFVVADPNGNLIVDPRTGLPLILVNNVFALTNEEFIRKRGQGSVNLISGKSNLLVGVFNERREYQLSNRAEDAAGINTAWTWRFKPRTSSLLGASWQRRNPLNTGAADDLWHVSLGLSRAVSTRTTTSIELRHTQRDVAGGPGYDENRLMARLSMRF